MTRTWEGRLHTFVVIPCRNEEAYLEATCSSLGFGGSGCFGGAELVLVDNGSSDGTADAMRRIKAQAAAGTVHLVSEPTQGFVPARRAGVARVQGLVEQRGLRARDVLLVQADADTEYASGYVAAMVDAASRAGPGSLLEGRTVIPASFAAAHPEYIALCDIADASVATLLVPAPFDVIVDDKACAYRVADYLAWGGLQREWGARGEIFAETSRLYLRAKAQRAQKIVVDEAVAASSRRRVIEHPTLQFVTAGYPRGEAWSRNWCRSHAHIDTLDAMKLGGRPVTELVFLRRAHSIILFGLLPAWVASALGTDDLLTRQHRLRPLLSRLPLLSLQRVQDAPGQVIEAALDLIDSDAAVFRSLLAVFAESS